MSTIMSGLFVAFSIVTAVYLILKAFFPYVFSDVRVIYTVVTCLAKVESYRKKKITFVDKYVLIVFIRLLCVRLIC